MLYRWGELNSKKLESLEVKWIGFGGADGGERELRVKDDF